jgi:hypothetical protein
LNARDMDDDMDDMENDYELQAAIAMSMVRLSEA